MIIAIDGPAGSGKSSAAKLLAEKLNLPSLNSGLLFRSLAWVCLELNINTTDSEACADIVRGLQIEIPGHEQAVVSYRTIQKRVLLEELRSHQVDEAVHGIASLPDVRREIHVLQRRIAEAQGGVVEGRTIGIHVLPDADFKFWLTAAPEVRLDRITSQRGAETASKMMARDEHDATREHEPMVPADDAIQVDSSIMNLEEVVDYMLQHINDKDHEVA